MYSEVTLSKTCMRSHQGALDTASRRSSSNATDPDDQREPCRCSWVLCVVVTFIVVTILVCVITVPLVPHQWTLHPTQVVSVRSKLEQQRLILIAKQDCFRLSERREAELQNGTAPFMGHVACEVAWDDLLCWDLTPAATTAIQTCPDYINGFNKNAIATRLCTANGTWWRNPAINGTWSNYTECLQPPIDLRYHAAHGDRLQLLYTVGYSISMGTLLIAVIIMLCCRRLHCKSNTLHINLFLAFILRGFTSFLKDLLFVGGVGLKKDVVVGPDGMLRFIPDFPHWECKTLITVFMYSVSACNMWILAEALYLTMLVQNPLVTERKGVRVYVVMGWMLPFICLVPWVVVKAFRENTFCWNIQHNAGYYWILRGPGVAVIVINLFLFLNIFRKLFMKLRQSSELGASGRAKYRKLAKFILVLIPLFGIMYILFYVVVPSSFEDDTFNVAYLYLEMTYNSFQGFLLALLFCFLNEEVHSELKRVWYRHRYRKGDLAAFTRSYAASSCRKTMTGSTRSQSPPFVSGGAGTSQTRVRTGSLSSQGSELLASADKRGTFGKRAPSFDPERHPLKEVRDCHHGDKLLRQAIKTNAAQKAALKKQSTVESTSSCETSPLTLASSPTEFETKFLFDKNQNSSEGSVACV